MKIVLIVEGHPELTSWFEYSYHWRWRNIIFVQGDSQEAFISFEDDKAEQIYEMILDAYELGSDDFTLNFPEEHAPAFQKSKLKEQVLADLLEKMND